MNTLALYDTALQNCRELFVRKTLDYGTAWRILRLPSLTDQIFIKAQRIRTIEEKGEQRVEDHLRDEFVGIVNYGILAMVQLHLPSDAAIELLPEQAAALYDEQAQFVRQLMLNKNHDYGDAWRSMRPSSFTDLILMKIFRVKQIEDNKGKTIVSEGLAANYADMVNYALFALVTTAMTAKPLL